ncbi:hypothetical protein M6B38_261770 [Iris pallida]|uniref:Uncharacterized protein n=1 Tax=Iris pallida TaxID=29817 RepID=A0AAX6IEI7_IRIPA|nr:hypothetical protein M6B38_261770 [Iris pallida]
MLWWYPGARRCSFVRNTPRTTVFRWWVSRDGVGRRKETKIEALTQVRIKVVVAWDGVYQQVASLPQRTRHGGGRRQDWAANTRSDGSRPEEDSDGEGFTGGGAIQIHGEDD